MKLKLVTNAIAATTLITSIMAMAEPTQLSQQIQQTQQVDTIELQDSAPESVIITGSRISRLEEELPNPIIKIEGEQLLQFATPDLGSILAELPAISASATLAGNNFGNVNQGLSSVDLRHLDAKRTWF